MAMRKPRQSKDVKAPEIEKAAPVAPKAKGVSFAVNSVASVRIMSGGAVLIVDGKQQTVEGGKVSINIEG